MTISIIDPYQDVQSKTVSGTPVPDGYKQTDFGLIPKNWGWCQLDSVCDVRDGTHASPRYFRDGIPFVTSKNIVNGKINFDDISYISERDAREINKRSKVDKDDVLVSMIGTIGNAVLVDSEPGFCIKNVALIKPRQVLPAFLYQLIQSPHFQLYLHDSLDGGIQKFIALGTLRQLHIPLPPLHEQRAIAEALADAGGWIAALDALITKKRAMKQGAMQQLLIGQTRLPGFTGEWEEKQLGEILQHARNGAVYRPTSEGGVAVTRIETISYGYVDASKVGRAERTLELEKYKVKSGDILYSHINSVDHIGKVALFAGGWDLYHGMNLLLLRCLDCVDSTWLYYMLASEYAKKWAQSVAKQAVSQASINTK